MRPDVLRDALAGRVPRVPPSVALGAISELDIPRTDQQALLREAVRDESLEPHIRAAAVRAYLLLGAEAAVPDLVEALDSSDERVAAAAAAAIGQLGGPDHLPALRRVRDRLEAVFPRRQAAFAETLIVHRFGVTDHDVEFPSADTQPAPEAVGGLPFTSVRPGRNRWIRALDGIRRELPVLDPAQQDVYELQCGPRLLEVAVALDVLGPDGLQALARRPALPAVVASHDEEHDEFSLSLLVLSRPSGTDRAALALTRLSGDVVYVGEGSVTGEEAAFELRAAQAPGIVPIAARVRLSAEGVEITGVSGRRAAPARSPDRIEPSGE
jgi:hypothetical protein